MGRKLIEKAVSSDSYNELRDETVLDSFKLLLLRLLWAEK